MSAHVRRPSRTRVYATSVEDAQDWRARGLCRYDDDPDRWFPVGRTDSALRRRAAEDAKEVCRRCPVVVACLNDALDRGITEGVYGGADEHERAAMLAGRAPRRVPLPQWGPCRGCGEKRIRPGASGSGLTCQECRDAKASKRRARKAARRSQTPVVAAVAPAVPDAVEQPACTALDGRWSRQAQIAPRGEWAS